MRTEENNLSTGVVVGGRRISNLRYADDTTIVGHTEDSAKKYFADLVEESAHSNMKINAKKTKAMVISRGAERLDISLEGEQVEEFKFLGSYKTATGDCTKEIRTPSGETGTS